MKNFRRTVFFPAMVCFIFIAFIGCVVSEKRSDETTVNEEESEEVGESSEEAENESSIPAAAPIGSVELSQKDFPGLGKSYIKKLTALDLTPEQVGKLKTIHDAVFPKDAANQSRDDLKSYMGEFRKGLKEVLTPEQYEKFKSAGKGKKK